MLECLVLCSSIKLSPSLLQLQGYGTFLAKLWDLYARAVQLQQQAAALLNNLAQVTSLSLIMAPYLPICLAA